jgi:hypothetical protein
MRGFSHGASFNDVTERVAIFRWLTDQFGSEKANCLDLPARVRFPSKVRCWPFPSRDFNSRQTKLAVIPDCQDLRVLISGDNQNAGPQIRGVNFIAILHLPHLVPFRTVARC